MVELIFLVPFLSGLVTFFVNKKVGRGLLVGTAATNFVVSFLILIQKMPILFGGFFYVNPEDRLILIITSILFLFTAIYTVFYIQEDAMENEKVFLSSMLFFIAMMSLVVLADNLIMLWVSIEATTLATTSLIFAHHNKKSLEAAWKYLMICSVGIALALLGSFFVAFSMSVNHVDVAFSFSQLITVASQLDPTWLKLSFIFILIGYGTKMGLAPMHTWLPDAHGEAPSPASALLSGALLNGAFLGIYKTHRLLSAAGLGLFSGRLLMIFGLVSLFVAAIFITKQKDYKRLLAYSSIENMGIIAFGTGVGGIAVFGALLHLLHHSLLKSSLFLSSGNIYLGYKSKLIEKVGNMTELLPKTNVAFLAGFLGVCGLPPFGTFMSKILIVFGAIQQGYFVGVTIFLVLIFLIIVGFSRYVFDMVFHAPKVGAENKVVKLVFKDTLLKNMPSYCLLGLSIFWCFKLPASIYQALQAAVVHLGVVL